MRRLFIFISLHLFIFLLVIAYQAQAEEEEWTIDRYKTLFYARVSGEVTHGDNLNFWIRAEDDCAKVYNTFTVSLGTAFNISQFKTDIKKFNKQNKILKIKKLFFNKIGASNHLGGSIPVTSNRSIKLGVSKFGKLNNQKNIYISDSSILNDIDISPITIFSLNNILRMILSNKKI